MEPIVHGLDEEYGKEIEFVYVDIDDPESATLKEQYHFHGQPQFVLVDGDGEVVTQWFGMVDGTVFEEAFQAVLN